MERSWKFLICLGLAACALEPQAAVGQDASSYSDELAALRVRVEALETAESSPSSNLPPQAPTAKRSADRRGPNITRPDPHRVYDVPTTGDPALGSEDAAVTLVVASDFACPFCRRAHATLQKLHDKYGDELRIVAKPLVLHEKTATIPALATCAADKQGKFFEMETAIWEQGWVPNEEGRPMPGRLERASMVTIATDLGLDVPTFEAELDGEACAQKIRDERRALFDLGVRGTPAFFINGRYLAGAKPLSEFELAIEREKAVALGRKPAGGGA